MKRAFGGRLTYLIRDRFAGVWSALGLGVFLTLILQSSTASALLAASLGVQGEAGLALLLGADVGTTLVALVLSFAYGCFHPAGSSICKCTGFADVFRPADCARVVGAILRTCQSERLNRRRCFVLALSSKMAQWLWMFPPCGLCIGGLNLTSRNNT